MPKFSVRYFLTTVIGLSLSGCVVYTQPGEAPAIAYDQPAAPLNPPRQPVVPHHPTGFNPPSQTVVPAHATGFNPPSQRIVPHHSTGFNPPSQSVTPPAVKPVNPPAPKPVKPAETKPLAPAMKPVTPNPNTVSPANTPNSTSLNTPSANLGN